MTADTPDRWATEAVEEIVAELVALGFKRDQYAINFLPIIWGRYLKACRCDTCSGTGLADDRDDGVCLECNGTGRTVPRPDE